MILTYSTVLINLYAHFKFWTPILTYVDVNSQKYIRVKSNKIINQYLIVDIQR